MFGIEDKDIKSLFKAHGWGSDMIAQIAAIAVLTNKPILEVSEVYMKLRKHVDKVVYDVRD
jgi:hypothetical protein